MSKLFRQEAVDSFSTDLEINKALKSIGIRHRFFAVIFVLCTAAFAVWLFTGHLYETICAEGIVGYSTTNSGVYASSAGIVKKTLVNAGDYVEVGDELAIIPDTKTLNTIEFTDGTAASDELEILYDRYEDNSMARAEVSGIVTYICNENSWVKEGDMIAFVTPSNSGLDDMRVTAYIPSSKKEVIDIGMKARVMPDYAPSEEYGYINAYISDIASYPEKGSSIMAESGNMVTLLDADEMYIKLGITMMYSSRSKNGLSWSSARGENLIVNMGTLCHTDIILSELTPYKWLMGGNR